MSSEPLVKSPWRPNLEALSPEEQQRLVAEVPLMLELLNDAWETTPGVYHRIRALLESLPLNWQPAKGSSTPAAPRFSPPTPTGRFFSPRSKT